jgi:hypothetical protein
MPMAKRKGSTDEQQERLREAAPALLDALKDALDSLEYVRRVDPEFSGWGVRDQRIRAAAAAIKKAEGEK